jgi:type IV pilus assembly protein PilA
MIVVAIIGILAAVAIPAYSDYMTKSKVGEASVLASGIKTCVETFYQEESFVPEHTAGSTTSPYWLTCEPKTAGKYVSNIEYTHGSGVPNTGGDNKATITVTLVGGGLGGFGGIGTVQWLFVPSAKEWTCSTGTTPASGTTVDDKYLPKACRSTNTDVL